MNQKWFRPCRTAARVLLITTSVAAFGGVMPRKGLPYELSEASHHQKQRHAPPLNRN